MSLFPDNDRARKMLVLFKYITRYFPKAHREVTKVCVVNNVRYNPDREPNDIHWARGKSPDQLGSAFRHMAEYEVDGKVFEDVPSDIAVITGIPKVYTLAEAMWRIGAQLELEIEKQEALANDPEWTNALTLKPYQPYTGAMLAEQTFAQREAAATTAALWTVPDCPICGDCKHVTVNSNSVLTQLPANEGYHCSYDHPIYYFGKAP